jgi:hypothetical protein
MTTEKAAGVGPGHEENLQVEYNLRSEDVEALEGYPLLEARGLRGFRGSAMKWWAIGWMLFFFLTFVYVALTDPNSRGEALLAIAGMVGVFALVEIISRRARQKRWQAAVAQGRVSGRIGLTPQGLVVADSQGERCHGWPTVRKIERVKAHLLIWFPEGLRVLPRHAFRDEASMVHFAQVAERYKSGLPSAPG